MVSTRVNKKKGNEDDVFVEDVEIEIETKGPPTSQPSFERRFLIAKEGTISGSQIYKLRHPKFNTGVLYRVGPEVCDEVVLSGEEKRSFFYGDSVIGDGAFRICVPVHPLFLALPYLLKKKGRFEELDEVLADEELPEIAVLKKNEQFNKRLEMIADKKEICDEVLYRYNEEKALGWLATRFSCLQKGLLAAADLHKSIIENQEVLDRYTFGLLQDYLPNEIVLPLKAKLNITDAPVEERIDQSFAKRKSEAFDDEYETLKPAAKKVLKESTAQKQLKVASKGTKSISSFFNKK
ncbi:unnamed protein product, partial [Mesorhabditis spiculigera]